MKIVCDEGVERQIVDALRIASHDVSYVAEMSPGISDDEVLERAAAAEAVVVTTDKDFGELDFRQGRAHHGVVLLRLHGLDAVAVLIDDQGRIAGVEGVTRGRNRYWLPGGGCESDESPEEAIEREVGEELGRRVSRVERFGEAVQVFYAEADECWFRMDTVFVRGELGDEVETRAEHKVDWLDPDRACRGFYHSSHAWAVRQCIRAEDGAQT